MYTSLLLFLFRPPPDNMRQDADYTMHFSFQINIAQVRYMDLLPTSSAAWTAVANAQSREPSTAGHSQADLGRTNSQAPAPDLDLHKLHTAFTVESTVSASRSSRILSLFRFPKSHRSPSRAGRASDDRERDRSPPATRPPTSFSLRSGHTESIIRIPPTRAPTAKSSKSEKGERAKGNKFSRSLGFIPSFIGNLGCHGMMIR